jgi:hypothetical protein
MPAGLAAAGKALPCNVVSCEQRVNTNLKPVAVMRRLFSLPELSINSARCFLFISLSGEFADQ